MHKQEALEKALAKGVCARRCSHKSCALIESVVM